MDDVDDIEDDGGDIRMVDTLVPKIDSDTLSAPASVPDATTALVAVTSSAPVTSAITDKPILIDQPLMGSS